MNLFQRAARSVIRKPVKSILLFGIVFVISLFMLSGLASRTASIETQDKTRQAVGAGFLLVSNETNRHRRLSEISERIGEEGGTLEGVTIEKLDTIYGVQFSGTTSNAFESLRIDEIKKLAEVPGISDYNITTAVTPVNPVNFARIEDPEADPNMDIQAVSLIGNRDMAMDANVLSGNVSLAAGRMVGPEDENVCVISKELAEKNGLTVGDTLAFNSCHERESSPVWDAEIIGIYRVQQDMTPIMAGDSFRSENVIFTDLGFPEKAQGEEDPLYEKAYFKVGEPEAYDSVKESLKRAEIDWERYDLIDNNGNYDTMSANFNNLERMSEILLWAAALASFFILFLIFAFWLKNRVQEVGIFLAMGEPKGKIIGQVLLEAVLIAAAALLVSFKAAPKAAGWMADEMVSRQVRQAEEEKKRDADKVAGGPEEAEQEVMGVSVSVTLPMLLSDGIFVLTLTGLSVISAGAVLLRKKPKDILSEMS